MAVGGRRGGETKPLLNRGSTQGRTDNTRGNKPTIIQKGQRHAGVMRADHTGPGRGLSQEHPAATASLAYTNETIQ